MPHAPSCHVMLFSFLLGLQAMVRETRCVAVGWLTCTNGASVSKLLVI